MRAALKKSLMLFAFIFCFLPFQAFASQTVYKTLEEIPVQHGGRIKPFQSFAREAALQVTGGSSFDGIPASELVWRWIAQPEEWNSRAMIQVPRMLRDDFRVMAVKGRISSEIILQHEPFRQKLEAAWNKRQKKETLTPLDKKCLELYDRANLFHMIAAGEIPGWIANPDDPRAGWLPLRGFSAEPGQKTIAQFYPEPRVHEVQNSLSELIQTLRESSPEAAAKVVSFRGALSRLLESRGVFLNSQILRFELAYNRLQPFSWAWKGYFLTALFLGLALTLSKWTGPAQKIIPAAAIGFLAASFLMHLMGFVLRCLIAGRPPVTNMYESIIWVSWAAVFFSIILFAVYRTYLIPLTSSLVACFALIIAESFPAVLDPAIAPLVPVLRSNLWLSVHVLTITMSYGAFALAWGLGHAVVIGYVRRPFHAESCLRLSSYLYRALQIGVILLATGTVLGGVWANYSWGRFWGWDPKETWALIALLGYLVVLHGRFSGWLDSFGAAVGSVIAFSGVVMAWYGVNFVLAAGLHSYGFGGGGAPYVIGVALADIILILALSAVYRRKVSRPVVQTY